MRFDPRFESRFGIPTEWGMPWEVPDMPVAVVPSMGTLLARLEHLISEAQEQLKPFASGKTLFFEHTNILKGRMQHCLVDLGEPAKEELRKLAALDLDPSEALHRYYRKGVFNDFDAPGDTEFVRLQ